jgi:hypothetical protein
MPDPIYRTDDRPTFGAVASGAVTAGQLVKVTGSGTVAPTSAITDVPCGQVLADAASGDVAVRGLVGVVELIASAAVSAGTTVEPSTTAGQVKPFTTGVKVGVALDTFAGSPLRGRVVVTPTAVS